MSSPTKTRRSPRQSNLPRPIFPPGTPTRRENVPAQPSPLRNEITKGRKRARSLGGGDDLVPSSTKAVNPRKKRMTIVCPLPEDMLELGLTGVGSSKGNSEKE